jgi:hypothetical protein
MEKLKTGFKMFNKGWGGVYAKINITEKIINTEFHSVCITV